jgi:hypothetical protein
VRNRRDGTIGRSFEVSLKVKEEGAAEKIRICRPCSLRNPTSGYTVQ